MDRDIETNAQEPWDVSTAYIRNAPMKSPWELGFIHRGEKWQTINLKKFNTIQAAKDGAGGDAYSYGDANILDQVKMTNDRETSDKTDINSDNIDKKLFEGVYVGSLKAPTNKKIDSTKVEELVKELSNLYDEKNPFKSRAEILGGGRAEEFRKLLIDENGSSLGLNQDNDAEQEEIIGKFINKTTTILGSPHTLRIIAIGESIKDLGNITIGGKTGKKGIFDIGADKILASQKIFVVMRSKKDPNSKYPKFYISKFKYVN